MSKRATRLPSIKCEAENNNNEKYKKVSVERPPYYSYMDSTSGQLEPASGARASIPGQEYWPEGTASRVRAARAPEPSGESLGSPSYGKNPGSRRRKQATSAVSPESSEVIAEPSEPVTPDISDDAVEDPKDDSSEFVVYQTEPDQEEETGYDLDKKLGRPHPFIDPKKKNPIENPLTSEELWWNWRKPDQEQWSRWQRRKPDVETVGA